jgi:O-antigen/teichoic acid export membrane protein
MSRAAKKGGSQMLRGSVWAIALRWSVRGIGLLSTLVLVRLLTPADFGIVAMAMLVVGTVEVISHTGQQLAIIRHPNPTREHYDSAWTISVLMGIGLSVCIFAAAPLATAYFHTPQAIPVIRCLALRTLIDGFENVGVFEFGRELQFRNSFNYVVAQRVATFFITIAAALVLRNYWALVIGIVADRCARVAFSYVLHPFRPRIAFGKVGELWSFSIWTWARQIGAYLTTKADEFIVSGMGTVGGLPGSVAMGRYNVAADVAAAPTDELVTPILTTLFPVMAKIQDDMDALRSLFLKALAWSAIACSATSVGIALVSNGIVALILGSQWLPIRTLMPWLALSQGVLVLGASVYVVFDVLGQPRSSAIAQWSRLLLLLAVLVPLSWEKDLDVIAMGRLAVDCVITPTLLWSVRRVLPVSIADFWSAVWRPIAAAALMAMAVTAIDPFLADNLAVRLALQIFAGAVAYAGGLLVLWTASGRPPGPEDDIIGCCHRVFRSSPPEPDVS